MNGIFVAATGTGCGKTWIARGLTRAARDAGRNVVALKPIETGVEHVASDAEALARASGRLSDAMAPGLPRLRAPLSPRAAALAGEPAIDLAAVVLAVRARLVGADVAVIEGAGGVLVPVARETPIVALARALELPVLLVAPDQLGTLSHTLTAVESCRARGVGVACIALVEPPIRDSSYERNYLILREETGIQTIRFPRTSDEDIALADAARSTGLSDLLGF